MQNITSVGVNISTVNSDVIDFQSAHHAVIASHADPRLLARQHSCHVLPMRAENVQAGSPQRARSGKAQRNGITNLEPDTCHGIRAGYPRRRPWDALVLHRSIRSQ